MADEIKGKTLIITGASLGMGRALALSLARHGVKLVLNARHAEPLGEVARACAALGVEARPVAGNAARDKVAGDLVRTALALGDFFGFIHVAGLLHPGPLLWELSPRRFAEVLESHVVAGYQLIRFAVPELLEKGGGLAVFFGSGAAVSNLPGIGAYCVAKAAAEHLARQLAVEAPQITSFIFRPGVVDTRMQAQAREAKGGAADILHRIFRGYKERGELETPEEAAQALTRILLGTPRRFHGKIIN
jgi:NAD(P)-dependent dehydrogenase (short-subunit alcohol dehydrogenase family)